MIKRILSSVLILLLTMLSFSISKAYAEEKLIIESINTNNYIVSEDSSNLEPTDPPLPTGIYESAYVHSLKSLPDKAVYEIGDELDLTGLKVDLEFYDQQGGHYAIYRDAYPLDNPDFIVDTSDFDNSKAGTYKIKISCADKFTAFYLPGPVYFEVTVNDPNSAATENTTTTAPVTTGITTTETTVVTTSIPIVTSVSPITSLYQRAYHLDINDLPNKTNYNIGDELDLTGLKVDLTYNDESNIYHNTDYINAYPLDYPDVFTVDTSKFDNSKAGTYTIEISCKYEYLHWFPPSAYLEVTVNDSGSSATTTTSTSSTDITTTVNTTTITVETNTEQTTEPPTTGAGSSVTTETSAISPTTTTGTETTLPQTGYSKWYQALIAAAMGMIGVGSTAIVRSGIFRKKENNS